MQILQLKIINFAEIIGDNDDSVKDLINKLKAVLKAGKNPVDLDPLLDELQKTIDSELYKDTFSELQFNGVNGVLRKLNLKEAVSANGLVPVVEKIVEKLFDNGLVDGGDGNSLKKCAESLKLSESNQVKKM